MASYIIDTEVEEKEAFLATILDLQVKKYLKSDKNENNQYRFNLTKKGIQNLYLHEKYVLECFENKRDLNLNEFGKIVRKDCIDYKLIVIKHTILSKVLTEIFLMSMIIFMLMMFVGEIINISGEFILWYIIFQVFLYYVLLFVKIERRTCKGIDFAIEMKGLKNYIRDHTLINEKYIDYTKLVDRYIPFAIALGEAENIEDKILLKGMM